MSFSYDDSLPTDKDKVRLLIGDTDSANASYSDEAISALLTDNNDDVYETAAQLADGLAAKYSGHQDIKIDGFNVSWGERAQSYRDMATRLRKTGKNAGGGFATPFISGTSISEMDTVRDDTDRNPSRFEIGQFTNPGNEPIERGEDYES